jgi:hypothetical protein
MTQGLVIQDPAETEPYVIDWAATLGEDTIDTSTWSIEPAGDVVLAAAANTETSASIEVSGLALGQVYRLLNTIVTAAGNTLADDFVVRAFPE